MSAGDGRARVLERVKAALANGAGSTRVDAPPPFDESAVMGVEIDTASLARQFRDELALVAGETVFVADKDAVAPAIAALADARGLGAATTDVENAEFGILHAEALFADTGSALVIERGADRRLAPYLPRTCIVIADAATLYPTLSISSIASLRSSALRAHRGEAVIITGPSRTADIEKTLVLGAHGPRHLIVIIYGLSIPEGAS